MPHDLHSRNVLAGEVVHGPFILDPPCVSDRGRRRQVGIAVNLPRLVSLAASIDILEIAVARHEGRDGEEQGEQAAGDHFGNPVR